MTWDNAGDNDGQGVVCILQGAPVWFAGLLFSGVDLTTTNCFVIVLSGGRRCAAMILVFFAVAGSFWWLTLTFNIFELLVLGMKRELVKKIYYFQHILNWGIPTVCVIIGAPPSPHSPHGDLKIRC
jgi:hypothetical protein